MKYTKFSFLYPPRPEHTIPGGFLSIYENKGWWAQAKKNGTCNIMAISPEREIVARTRRNEPHKAWQPSEHTKKSFTNLPGKGWYVFVAELMHSKVHRLKDINYINDILVADSEYLIDMTYADRQKLLSDLFIPISETSTYYIIDPHTWLAKNHMSGFYDMFMNMTPEIEGGNHENEGLVVKDPTSILALCSRNMSNSDWLVKSRHPTVLNAF